MRFKLDLKSALADALPLWKDKLAWNCVPLSFDVLLTFETLIDFRCPRRRQSSWLCYHTRFCSQWYNITMFCISWTASDSNYPYVHFTSTLNANNAYSNLVVLILPSNYLRDHNHTLQEKNETSTLSNQSGTLPPLISLQTIYFLHQRIYYIPFKGARTNRAAVTLIKYWRKRPLSKALKEVLLTRCYLTQISEIYRCLLSVIGSLCLRWNRHCPFHVFSTRINFMIMLKFNVLRGPDFS